MGLYQKELASYNFKWDLKLMMSWRSLWDFLYCPASQSQTQPRDGEATSLVWDIGWREQEAQWPFLVNLKTEKPSEEEIKSKSIQNFTSSSRKRTQGPKSRCFPLMQEKDPSDSWISVKNACEYK